MNYISIFMLKDKEYYYDCKYSFKEIGKGNFNLTILAYKDSDYKSLISNYKEIRSEIKNYYESLFDCNNEDNNHYKKYSNLTDNEYKDLAMA